MIPPKKLLRVLDQHGGFTIEDSQGTLWRPGKLLPHTEEATLVSYDERSFYQLNNDVTQARYRVRGFKQIIICWFDNKTGERIA